MPIFWFQFAATSSKALWEVEVLREIPTYGGIAKVGQGRMHFVVALMLLPMTFVSHFLSRTPWVNCVQWDNFYRFKHLSSETYLAAHEDPSALENGAPGSLCASDGRTYALAVTSDRYDSSAIWEINGTGPQHGNELVRLPVSFPLSSICFLSATFSFNQD